MAEPVDVLTMRLVSAALGVHVAAGLNRRNLAVQLCAEVLDALGALEPVLQARAVEEPG